MTVQEIAEKLNGIEYPIRIPQAIITAAKNSGIVIVYGASDDLMEFEGAISDEVGAYDGGTVRIDADGVVPDFDNVDKDDKEALREYFRRENSGKEIEALWCDPSDDYSWSYKTDIPHEVFDVFETNGDEKTKYCRGIVFSLADVA